MSKIPDGKRAIGDNGYKGEPSKVATKNHLDREEVAKLKNRRIRARHETFNGQIKFFKVLEKDFNTAFTSIKFASRPCAFSLNTS